MKTYATAIGFSAIILWSFLALFTSLTSGIPAFQLLFLTFLLGGTVGLLFILFKRTSIKRIITQPLKVWLIGIGGLFGYHFFYFLALKNAPVADASLIAYLWPVLIVLFSSLIQNEQLKWHYVFGVLIAFIGASLLILTKENFSFSSAFFLGYLMAFLSAIIWALYSVFNRSMKHIETDIVAFYCLSTAILGGLCHLLLENWVMPNGAQWLAIVTLGLGPVGLAFYAWDYATKHGNLRLLGVTSYMAPLLSTILLTLSGQVEFNKILIVSCLLIIIGALFSSLKW